MILETTKWFLFFACIFGLLVLKYSCSTVCKLVNNEFRRNLIMMGGTLVFVLSGIALSIYRNDDPDTINFGVLCGGVVVAIVFGAVICNITTTPKGLVLPE
ncbi:MAG: hypothetical protein NTY04_03760 [Candidatus Staskawiczbacteria bacterium]|nr:hypothetical protein [Candidatus Staskawiczbacteria bacterium]